jgi:hypothetical protein
VGKAAIAEAYRMLNIKFENLGSQIHEILIDGDRGGLLRSTAVRERGADQTRDLDVINVTRFHPGLIVEMPEYSDSAAYEATRELRGQN